MDKARCVKNNVHKRLKRSVWACGYVLDPRAKIEEGVDKGWDWN